MKKIALASTLALVFAGTAFADPEPKKEAKPADKAVADKAAPVKAEAPPAMEMKPAAELEQLKGMIGTWKCSGKVTAMGQEMASESTVKSAWDLDNYWVVSNMAEKKKGKEPAYKAHDLTGYDASTKTFVRMSVDNMGTSSTVTSKGWEGDKMEWTGSAKMMGKDMKLMETITKDATGKQITMAGHYMSGADKPVAWAFTCKK